MAELTCKEVIEFLASYREGDLEPEVRKEFEAHLRCCPPCVGYLHSYEKTILLSREAMRDDSLPPAPESLVRAILRARRPGA